ncbi:hypothetical protein QCA50_018550 [Cerrena zonata]|uniref:Uncharacterized protein n=1 Tax=Cerrena zonata TaxID=2478898 RepID=A0AAW0FJZ4_9APHY
MLNALCLAVGGHPSLYLCKTLEETLSSEHVEAAQKLENKPKENYLANMHVELTEESSPSEVRNAPDLA